MQRPSRVRELKALGIVGYVTKQTDIQPLPRDYAHCPGPAVGEAGVTTVDVVIADDHPVYLDGLARAIAARPELALIARATDGESTLELVRSERPQAPRLTSDTPDGRSRCDRPRDSSDTHTHRFRAR